MSSITFVLPSEYLLDQGLRQLPAQMIDGRPRLLLFQRRRPKVSSGISQDHLVCQEARRQIHICGSLLTRWYAYIYLTLWIHAGQSMSSSIEVLTLGPVHNTGMSGGSCTVELRAQHSVAKPLPTIESHGPSALIPKRHELKQIAGNVNWGQRPGGYYRRSDS